MLCSEVDFRTYLITPTNYIRSPESRIYRLENQKLGILAFMKAYMQRERPQGTRDGWHMPPSSIIPRNGNEAQAVHSIATKACSAL